MKILGVNPRNLIFITAFLLITILVLGILFSAQSFLISLAASLIGLLGGILAAIFIVERYLKYQKQQLLAKQATYKIMWQSYIEGGLSVLSALITHACLFISFGRERYLILQEAIGDTTDVPDTIADFIPWLVTNLRVEEFSTPFERNANSSDTTLSRGMSKDQALLFKEEFSRNDCITSIYTLKDLIVLRNFLNMINKKLRDEVFLLQPFLSIRMQLGVTLVELSRYVEDACEEIMQNMIAKGKTSFHLDSKFSSRFCTIGLKSVKLITSIWTYVEDGFSEPAPTF